MRTGRRRGAGHLHRYGEHLAEYTRRHDQYGSPPRPWRALRILETALTAIRVTSTGVESTPARSRRGSSTRGHLHGRGEHLGVADEGSAGGGGHLHGRGEHLVGRDDVPGAAGSPPRAWRARHGQSSLCSMKRVTSTGVESTTGRCRSSHCPPGHLHGCGEHGSVPAGPGDGRGSPPRAWRAHRGSTEGLARRGHLHGRGEHRLTACMQDWHDRSPPRAWRAHLPTCTAAPPLPIRYASGKYLRQIEPAARRRPSSKAGHALQSA